MDTIKTREVVEQLMERLRCKRKLLCTFIGVTETTLGMNIKKPFSEIKHTKTGKRLFSLGYVVSALSSDPSLNAESLVRTLTSPHYEMADGTIMDVIAGIHCELPNELLVSIAEKALSDFRKEYKSVPKADEFFRRLSSA